MIKLIAQKATWEIKGRICLKQVNTRSRGGKIQQLECYYNTYYSIWYGLPCCHMWDQLYPLTNLTFSFNIKHKFTNLNLLRSTYFRTPHTKGVEKSYTLGVVSIKITMVIFHVSSSDWKGQSS
jgi:hypothetical protein